MDKYLILENGMVFKGKAFGADKNITAEVVFTTAMTGYLETLTDKSYTGQAVVQTFPLIGNYGVIPEDFESSGIGASAYIVREPCAQPSNFRSEGTLEAFLKKHDIPGLYGIDTRALTRVLRENGVMNGAITSAPDSINTEELKKYRINNPVSRVSVKEPYTLTPEKTDYNVVMLDFGLKENICRSLVKRGCSVTVLPYDTAPAKILSLKPDGIFLSNGPGNPQDNASVIKNLKELMSRKIPTMGICLGHQLLALASGFDTEKLKYGHRGANHPVKYAGDGKTYISSQNHGYTVIPSSVDPQIAAELFTNVNDGTNEGLIYKNAPVFSVQFHPEACGGPRDTDFLFDKFIQLMKEEKQCR